MDLFFKYYEWAVRLLALAGLFFVALYFALWLFPRGGITGALGRLMVGDRQSPPDDGGYLHVKDDQTPPGPSEESPDMIL
ncbi:MAG: hypothetical protein IJY89_05225 [Clostridia bacterium]|nr:hypothetical protein [Clostridia bacterium]